MNQPDPQALAEWARTFAVEATSDEAVEEFVRVVDERIASQIPEIAADPMLLDDLHQSTRTQWRTFAAALPLDHSLTLPSGARELARSLARRGLDLSVLLKVYRSAGQAVFNYIADATERLSEDDPPKDGVLKFLWSRAEQWMDDSVEVLIETFYEERHTVLESAMLRRGQLIEALLGGGAVNMTEASVELSHPLPQWQTAFVLWTPAADAGAGQRLVQLAEQVARRIGAPRPVTYPASNRDLWFWTATPTRPDLDALNDVIPDLDREGARITAGIPASGAAGFRSSHEGARAAQRLSLRAARPQALVRYDEVELLCLVGDSGPLVDRLVQREIGPLCGSDRNLALIRETALTFLTSGLSFEAAAERLFVHKNTVRYRIGRAEELLGRPLIDRLAATELALRSVALLGPPTP